VGVKFGLVWMDLVGVCFSIGHFKFVLWQAGFFLFYRVCDNCVSLLHKFIFKIGFICISEPMVQRGENCEKTERY